VLVALLLFAGCSESPKLVPPQDFELGPVLFEYVYDETTTLMIHANPESGYKQWDAISMDFDEDGIADWECVKPEGVCRRPATERPVIEEPKP
jgi:hypothetical protein